MKLYRYVKGGDPEQLRHWSIEVTAEKKSYNADLKNETDGQPDAGASVNDWLQWANNSKPKAWTRKLSQPGKVQNIGLDDVKEWEIPEDRALAAITVLEALFSESNPANKTWRWDLNGRSWGKGKDKVTSMSCFEFVARVLRVALPDQGIPAPPTDDASREALLKKLTELVKS